MELVDKSILIEVNVKVNGWVESGVVGCDLVTLDKFQDSSDLLTLYSNLFEPLLLFYFRYFKGMQIIQSIQ